MDKLDMPPLQSCTPNASADMGLGRAGAKSAIVLKEAAGIVVLDAAEPVAIAKVVVMDHAMTLVFLG
jgi:hypothetical protein